MHYKVTHSEATMAQQFTLWLPAELARQLEQAAKRLRRERSEVVRLALEQFLAIQVKTRPIEHVRDLLGQVESGVPDLGQRHRRPLCHPARDA
ncbi:MAG: hypothetical protein C4309_02175 [Chloroflexota bacterium]